MRAADLLLKLIDIERAIGVEEPFKLREMVIQAQEGLLAIQKTFTEHLAQGRLAPATVAVFAQDSRRARFAAQNRDF